MRPEAASVMRLFLEACPHCSRAPITGVEAPSRLIKVAAAMGMGASRGDS
jgi:hypothetical protein